MKKIFLGAAYEEFLNTYPSPSTKKTWRHPLRRFEGFLRERGIRNPYLAQEKHLLAFINHLRNDPMPGAPEPYKENTVATNRTALRAFYQWAVDQRKVTWSPANRLSRIRLTLELRPNPLGGDERARLIREIVNPATFEDCRNALAIALGICQGFRIHEVCKVKIADFDFKAGTLHVLGKMRKRAELPLDPVVAHLAKRMLKFQYDAFGDPRLCPVEYLLAQRGCSGKKAGTRLLHLSFKKTMLKCKIKGHRFHDLRATFITKIWTESRDQFVVTQLGRCTMETAQHYIGVSWERKAGVIARIGRENSRFIKTAN